MLKFIVKTIQEYVEVEEKDINENTLFMQDLHLTSYELVCMIGTLEDHLGVEIPDREIREIQSVGELMEFIQHKMGGTKG